MTDNNCSLLDKRNITLMLEADAESYPNYAKFDALKNSESPETFQTITRDIHTFYQTLPDDLNDPHRWEQAEIMALHKYNERTADAAMHINPVQKLKEEELLQTVVCIHKALVNKEDASASNHIDNLEELLTIELNNVTNIASIGGEDPEYRKETGTSCEAQAMAAAHGVAITPMDMPEDNDLPKAHCPTALTELPKIR